MERKCVERTRLWSELPRKGTPRHLMSADRTWYRKEETPIRPLRWTSIRRRHRQCSSSMHRRHPWRPIRSQIPLWGVRACHIMHKRERDDTQEELQ